MRRFDLATQHWKCESRELQRVPLPGERALLVTTPDELGLVVPLFGPKGVVFNRPAPAVTIAAVH